MRLWHKYLLEVLPAQQLLGQWRECCLIASELAKNHTPNHILVNPILDYDPTHFEYYCHLVYSEMVGHDFAVNEKVCKKLEDDLRAFRIYFDQDLPWSWKVDDDEPSSGLDILSLFPDWHNKRYLRQCYYNLEEKFDRGGISDAEWDEVIKHYVILGGAIK